MAVTEPTEEPGFWAEFYELVRTNPDNLGTFFISKDVSSGQFPTTMVSGEFLWQVGIDHETGPIGPNGLPVSTGRRAHVRENSLAYDVAARHFLFEVELSIGDNIPDVELVRLLEKLFLIVFFALEKFAKGDLTVFERLDIFDYGEPSDADYWNQDPFPDDLRMGCYQELWVTPWEVRLKVFREAFDPSFGEYRILSDYSVLAENRLNWTQTNFQKVEPRAYLERLREQGLKALNSD